MATTTVNDKGDWIFLCGDTLILSLTGLGNITARTNLIFTIKEQTTDADAAAIVQIDENTGLLVINGAVALVPASGTITVTNATTGAVTVKLKSDETVKVAACNVYYWDIKELAADDTRLKAGRCRPVSDITREVT